MNHVIVTDITSAILHMDMEGSLHTLLEGPTWSLLSKLTVAYIENVCGATRMETHAMLAVKGGTM